MNEEFSPPTVIYTWHNAVESLKERITLLEQRVTMLEPCRHNEGWRDVAPMNGEACNKCGVIRYPR